jgi:hypothetical protein
MNVWNMHIASRQAGGSDPADVPASQRVDGTLRRWDILATPEDS